jgi:nucleoside-diphosphate-sugar epimerase
MDILITGGAGYIGNLLAKSLLERGESVTVVDNFMYGYDALLHIAGHPRLDVIKTDIRNEDHSYLKGKDVIYHLAAISGYPACEANPNSARLINVEATESIVKNLDKDQCLIYASTTSFYGSEGRNCDENTPVEPVSLYGVTKYQAEQIVMQRENSMSLRWATVFGISPRMRAGLLVNDFVERAIHEGTLVLYSSHSKRSFMHLRDTVKGYLFALDHLNEMSGEIFNMGSERLNFSKRDIADAILKYVKFEIIESNVFDKDIRSFEISYAKARALGYECKASLDEGVQELIRLYKFYDPNSFIRPI